MTRLSRRQYLGGLAGAAGLAGCLGGGGGSSSDEERDVPTLDTVAVGDSPAGTVPARPAGEPAIVDFFATWCAPCKPQMAELRSVLETFPNLHMVSVTRERDEDAIRQFWQEYEGTWPVGSDPTLQLFQHYNVKNVPTKVLVDSNGNVQWRHSGLAAAETINEKVEEVF